MNDRTNRGVLSRLPADDAYWEALTDRLVTDAAGLLPEYRSPETAWWRGLARFSMPLAAGAAAALIAATAFWSPRSPAPAGSRSPVAIYGFAPNDPLAVAFIEAAVPPTLATLMAARPSEVAP